MKTSIYRANFQVLYKLVDGVFNQDLYANKLLEKEFRTNKKLGSRDRKFIAENIYDMVRWWRKLLACSGLHQTHFLQKSAYTDEQIYHLLSSWFVINGWGLPDFLSVHLQSAKESSSFMEKK